MAYRGNSYGHHVPTVLVHLAISFSDDLERSKLNETPQKSFFLNKFK